MVTEKECASLERTLHAETGERSGLKQTAAVGKF